MCIVHNLVSKFFLHCTALLLCKLNWAVPGHPGYGVRPPHAPFSPKVLMGLFVRIRMDSVNMPRTGLPVLPNFFGRNITL